MWFIKASLFLLDYQVHLLDLILWSLRPFHVLAGMDPSSRACGQTWCVSTLAAALALKADWRKLESLSGTWSRARMSACTGYDASVCTCPRLPCCGDSSTPSSEIFFLHFHQVISYIIILWMWITLCLFSSDCVCVCQDYNSMYSSRRVQLPSSGHYASYSSLYVK